MSYYRQGPYRPSGSGVGIAVPPFFGWVKRIVIACAAIWVVQTLFRGIPFAVWLGVVPDLVVFRGFVWQPLTYMFLHAPGDVFHIGFNMLMLWMFGSELERTWGGRAFLRYYLACGIGGGVFAVALGLLVPAFGGSPFAGQAATIGASGAVYGLLIAFGTVFAERTVMVMLMFPMKARTMALIFFGLTFLFTISGTGGGVSHVAHLGGAVVGFLVLKRAWRVGPFLRDLRWRIRRRRFKVMPPSDRDDFDRWVN